MCGGLNRGCTTLPPGGRELRKATPIHAARPARIPSRENKVGQGEGRPESRWLAHLLSSFGPPIPAQGKYRLLRRGEWVGWTQRALGLQVGRGTGKGQLRQAYLERRGRGWLLSS